MSNPIKFARMVVLSIAALMFSGAAMAVTISRHDQTASGLLGWRVQDENIKIELNPLQQDQVRAFYLGRGFSESLTEQIMSACVYQAVIENVTDATVDTLVDVNLADWYLDDGAGPAALLPKDVWLDEWTKSGASAASVLAFKWATFPTQQAFKLTGDYGWGMILFGRQINETFDLKLKWYTDGLPVEQLVEGLSCPD